MVKWVGGQSGSGVKVYVWPKCVCVVKVSGQSVCMGVWPKCVEGSSGWVGGEVGWGSSGCVAQVCLCGQSVCMCVA